MANGNDPANIPYIIAENGFYYVAYKEKVKVPEVVVSAKGVANGLSEEYNDGWDFGPDSYDPSSTASIPYTQTSGWQEAINYALANNYSIYAQNGQYIITAPFIQDPNATSNYYQIGIPVSASFQTLRIVCGGVSPLGYSYPGGGTTSQPNDLLYSGPTPASGVQFLSQPPSVPSGSVTNSVLYVLASSNSTLNNINFTELHIVGSLRVTIPSGYAITGMDFYFAENLEADELIADIDLSQSNDIPDPSSASGSDSTIFTYSFVGIVLPASLSNGGMVRSLYVVGYYTGIFLITHTVIERAIIQSCYNAMTLYGTGHVTAVINYANVQQCVNTIYNQAGSGVTKLMILSLDTEVNYGITSGPEAWMNFNSDYTTAGATLEGIIYFHKQGYGTTTQTSTTFYSSVANPNFKAICVDGNYPPSISANPPVSATAYQNTNPFDIRIYLPAYATTSGTAGSVAIALGSSSTPSAIGTKYINGSTSSSATDIIELVVPAGWYYEFTLTGVTLGTATVFSA